MVRSEPGVLVPTPNRLLVASQNKSLLSCDRSPPVPVKRTEPAVREENKGAEENVLAPAMVWAPVFTAPLAVAEASGILNVWVVPVEEILKSVPDVPVAKVCVAPVSPLRLVMAPPLAVKVDIGIFRTRPLVMVSRLSALVEVPTCTPVSVNGLVATTWRAVAGAAVPIPSRLLAAFQNRLLLFCDSSPPVLMKGMDPTVSDDNKGAEENVLAPAKACAPVVTSPRAVADASGILNVWVVPVEEILKSVPDVPVAKVCVTPVNPLRLVMAPPLAVKVDIGIFRTRPLVMVSRLSAVVLVPACTPISVNGLVVATTWRAVAGAVVPIPNRLLAASQNKSLLSCDRSPPVLMKGMEPTVSDDNKGAEENVLAPAKVCALVVTSPLAVADAFGILNVWEVPVEEILKSVPDVPVAKVCVAPVSPLRLVMAPPLAVKVDMGIFRTRPLVMVSRLSAVVLVPACTPISVNGLVVATTWRAVAGAVVPIPSRLLAASQNKSLLSCDRSPPVPVKRTEPAVREENKGTDENVLAPAMV